MTLHPNLLRAVQASGFTVPTPVQAAAIPVALAGRDLMASAQTGSGKTAAFVLPALQRLQAPSQVRGRGPRILVLTPTRELALQVTDSIRQFGRFSRVVTGSVVGGVSYGPQYRLLERPLDLLVATPGRLLDHMGEGLVDFSRLEMLVLDEADRMLDMGFIGPVRTIAAATPVSRQTLLFSATLEGQVHRIATELLRDPEIIRMAASREQHPDIRQSAFRADDRAHKHQLLCHHVAEEQVTQAVIFTATKRGADRLAEKLSREGHAAAPLHGDMRQAARKRTVDKMREGRIRLLVATDVAARGLDIRSISHVFNFDLPNVAEDYIHRIGRTGRAGDSGHAISLVGPEDWERLQEIERLTGRSVDWEVVPGLEPATPEPRKQQPARGKGGNGGAWRRSGPPRGGARRRSRYAAAR